MKAKNLFGMLLLFLSVFSFAGCDDVEDEKDDGGWYNSIPDGGFFSRANTVRFYYIDGNGNSLINPEERGTYPVSWYEEVENPIERTEDYQEYGNYNGNHNWIYYDKEEGLYYCTMSAYGDSRQSSYSFPIYVNGDKDILEITYKYTDKDVIGGKYWSKIISWKYNGVHVYSDDDELYKKVFIKKANGKTTVSLTR